LDVAISLVDCRSHLDEAVGALCFGGIGINHIGFGCCIAVVISVDFLVELRVKWIAQTYLRVSPPHSANDFASISSYPTVECYLTEVWKTVQIDNLPNDAGMSDEPH
jgi:hypothetical protein